MSAAGDVEKDSGKLTAVNISRYKNRNVSHYGFILVLRITRAMRLGGGAAAAGSTEVSVLIMCLIGLLMSACGRKVRKAACAADFRFRMLKKGTTSHAMC